MRLINTLTRQFEEFIGSDIPRYAILSHTWEEEEVPYKDYGDGNCQGMKGYSKIDMTCRIAAEEGIRYAWVDTCCIDKSSSAELSEAINSMFRWYQRAVVCYVYLSDLETGHDWQTSLPSCRWFTRGWTLQELIAPSNIVFFDTQWKTKPGSRSGTKATLARELSEITQIDQKFLSGQRTLSSFCVAQKMSWAARRTTTRKEDIAYCLLGIFGIHMPLLYGEEDMAFIRLQEEIMKSTPDPSILAWKLSSGRQNIAIGSHNSVSPLMLWPGWELKGSVLLGVMSHSPAEFADCRDYEHTAYDGLAESAVTNIGIKTRAPLYSMYRSEQNGTVSIYPLHCALNRKSLGLLLRHVGRRCYLRQSPCTLVEYTPNTFLRNPPAESYLLTRLPRIYRWSDFRLAPMNATMRDLRAHVLHFTLTEGMTLYDPWPIDLYDSEDQLFFIGHIRKEDIALIGLNCRVTISPGDNPHTAEMRCILVASGWSKPSDAQGKFSLLDAETDGSKVDVLRDRLRLGQDTRPSWVVLREAGLPTTLTVKHCVPGTGIVAVISCQPTRQLPDATISDHLYYDIKFVCNLYNADDASIPEGT